MPAPIIEVFEGAADDNNIMAAPSRLNSIPYAGSLVLEMSCTQSDASNYVEVTVQMPNGEVPMEGVRVPANGYDTADDVLHNDTEFTLALPAPQGGHFNVDVNVTGTVRWLIRAVLQE